jgi:ribonuclease HI
VIEIYTDGSCHTDYCIGAWAAILFIGKDIVTLQGDEMQTTHNRMELLAVIRAIEFLDEQHRDDSLLVYSDSQYVCRIPERMDKLKQKHFLTNKGTPIQNVDLVRMLIQQIETHTIQLVKVKAHQQPGNAVNYNNEVDQIAREIVRAKCSLF